MEYTTARAGPGSGQLATSQLTGAQKNMQNTHWIMLTKCKPFEITEQQ